MPGQVVYVVECTDGGNRCHRVTDAHWAGEATPRRAERGPGGQARRTARGRPGSTSSPAEANKSSGMEARTFIL